METTIAVRESTLQMLTRLKEKMSAQSIDDTIVKVLQKTGNAVKSRFGTTPRLKSFSEKERALSHGL